MQKILNSILISIYDDVNINGIPPSTPSGHITQWPNDPMSYFHCNYVQNIVPPILVKAC